MSNNIASNDLLLILALQWWKEWCPFHDFPCFPFEGCGFFAMRKL